jgi:hypothetical protein
VSDELTVNLRIEFLKDGAPSLRYPFQDGTHEEKYDVTGTEILAKNQEIGTGTPEAITGADDITVGGYILLKNMDDTNYISMYDSGNKEALRLLPGDLALFRTGAHFNTEYKFEASTAACKMLIVWIEL